MNSSRRVLIHTPGLAQPLRTLTTAKLELTLQEDGSIGWNEIKTDPALVGDGLVVLPAGTTLEFDGTRFTS